MTIPAALAFHPPLFIPTPSSLSTNPRLFPCPPIGTIFCRPPRRRQPHIALAEGDGGRWREEKKEEEDDSDKKKKPLPGSNGELRKALALGFRWRDLLDPDPENIVAVGLTGLLALATVQALWHLFFISIAILLAALKYSFIAALLLFLVITLL